MRENTGLTAAEVAERLAQYGPNQIVSVKRRSLAVDFLILFKNPLVLILLGAGIISAFFRDWADAVIIIVIVFVSVVLDFLNTYRSQQAAERLKERVRITTAVVRDGQIVDLPLADIVPDDIVLLTAGDLIPADGLVLESKDLFTNESALTGESFPQEKHAQSTVYMGSSVISGTARVQVTATGKLTEYSHIAKGVSETAAPTEFDRNIAQFSVLVMKITFVLVVVIFLSNAVFKKDVLESFLFAAALAVGLTPELLPIIIALNLSKGSLALAKRGVIVKRLSAVQNFGSMDILCTDKTGTLTEDRITVVKYVSGEGQESNAVLEHAYVNSMFSTGFNNPLDTALRQFKTIPIQAYTKLDEIPFDYTRKRDAIVVAFQGQHFIISKGQPEAVMTACAFYESAGVTLTDERKATIQKTFEDLSRDGFRVLAVARKDVPLDVKVFSHDLETDMVFTGFVAFYDPPKMDVSETLQKLEQYGLEIKIVTGDSELVAEKVVRDIKLPTKGTVVGKQILTMSPQELQHVVEAHTIFARVSPEQKQQIIAALKANRHVVGYMGDGINDAPSLHSADVGISVDNATDIAKESADLILLKKSLADLVEGVIEGRRTFSNTIKYLMMALSSNYGNMFSMAGASLVLPFLPMLPTQILLNNLLYDVSQFALPVDNVDEVELRRPQRFNLHFIKSFMLVFGPVSSLFDFVMFALLLLVFHLTPHQFQTGWFLESIATQALVVYVIRTKKPFFWQSHPALALILSTVGAVVVGWTVALSPLGRFFGFTNIGPGVIAAVVGVVVLYGVTVAMVKVWFYRKFNNWRNMRT